MPLDTAEDKDDVFIENLNTALLLLLGVLAIFASVAVSAHSAIVLIYGQQLGTSLVAASAFAVFLLVFGWASLRLFRKRRRQRKEKTSSIFYRVR